MALNESNQGGRPGGAERDPGLDRLYRASGREGPPAHLDAAILAAARREVGARPRILPQSLRRWHVPVSIAAVVVLSVSLVTLVREEGGEQLMQAPQPAPARPPVAQPDPPASPMSEMPRPGSPATAPAQPPAARSTPSSRPAPREEARSDDAPSALGRMADSAAGGSAAPSASQGAGSVSGERDAAARSRPEPLRDTPSEAERRAATPPAAPAEDLAARAPTATERSPAPMVPAPAAKPAPRPKAMAQARKEAAYADAPTPVWQGYEKEPPQRWLERIAELRRLERIADAEAMLAEFKRRFPEHPLPPGTP